MDRAALKTKAKAQLGGSIFSNNWLLGVVVSLVVSAASNITGPVSLLLVGILSVANVGFYKTLVREQKARIESAVEGVGKDIGGALTLGILFSIFVALWSLLFVIPGLVKAYAYSMAFYLKDEHPEWDWKKCLDESQRLTNGHKWELFVLDLSFIGWYIVGSIALGVGTLWVNAYHETTKINYFEELTQVM